MRPLGFACLFALLVPAGSFAQSESVEIMPVSLERTVPSIGPRPTLSRQPIVPVPPAAPQPLTARRMQPELPPGEFLPALPPTLPTPTPLPTPQSLPPIPSPPDDGPKPPEPSSGNKPAPTPTVPAAPPTVPLPVQAVILGEPFALNVTAEILQWYVRGYRPPALVSSSPTATVPDDVGLLNAPSTTVVYGARATNDAIRPGYRLGGLWWFNDDHTWGLSGTFAQLQRDLDNFDSLSFSGSASIPSVIGTPFLARPYTDENGDYAAELINYTAVVTGQIAIKAQNRFLTGDVNLTRSLWVDGFSHLRLLAGYRIAQMEDVLDILEATVPLEDSDTIQSGSFVQQRDLFRTRNTFHGAQLGLDSAWEYGRCRVEVIGKFAIGTTRRDLLTQGSSFIIDPSASQTQAASGFLAQPTNSGAIRDYRFAVLPELNANLGWRISEHVRVKVGYTLLWWSTVSRPSDLIDSFVNPSQFPLGTLTGIPRPLPRDAIQDAVIQGVNFGCELRY